MITQCGKDYNGFCRILGMISLCFTYIFQSTPSDFYLHPLSFRAIIKAELPALLPQMYGKNLTFKTGGVVGCDCAEILRLIEAGKIDTTPLITHRFQLEDIEEAYRIFENKLDGVIKVAVIP